MLDVKGGVRAQPKWMFGTPTPKKGPGFLPRKSLEKQRLLPTRADSQ